MVLRKSLFRIVHSTIKGDIVAHIPKIASKLNIFEPIMLLRAISLEPSAAADMLTASSGALVPQATIVSPIIKPDTLKFFARAALPSTK